MNLDHYKTLWNEFVARHNIPVDIKARELKLVEEVCEYLEASRHSTKEHGDAEAIDCLITVLALIQARGIVDPLHYAAMNLERATDRYGGTN